MIAEATSELNAQFVRDAILFLVAVSTIWSNVKGDKKREVTINPDMATKSDLSRLEHTVAANQATSDKWREQFDIHTENVRRELSGQMNAFRLELSEKIDNQAKEFGDALRDVPGKVLSTLRDATAIDKK